MNPEGTPKRTIDEHLAAAMADLETERRRVSEVSRIRQEESVTLHDKGRAFAVTVDGRNELTEIKFEGGKYRTMAPSELGHRLVETVNQARAQMTRKTLEPMSESSAFGDLDLAGLAAGTVDPTEIADKLMGAVLKDVDRPGTADRGRT